MTVFLRLCQDDVGKKIQVNRSSCIVAMGAPYLKAEIKFKRAFETYPVSWNRLVKIATTVSWADWCNNAVAPISIITEIQNNADHFIMISEELSISIESIVKNAIATAPTKDLPIAALTVAHLLAEKKLAGDPKDWRKIFPTPKPFEYFLLRLIDGKFAPKPSVFRELLKAADKTDAQTNCILNLLFSSGDFPASSSKLFLKLKHYPEIKKIDAERLFLSLESFQNTADLLGDIELTHFKKLPKSWQTLILDHPDRIKFYLSDEFVQQLIKDPFLIPNTKQALREISVRKELLSDLKNHELNISKKLVVSIRSDGFFNRMDQIFNWSFLKNLHVSVLQIDSEASLQTDFEYLTKGLPARSAGNIALLFLVWKSHEQPLLNLKDNLDNLDSLIKSGTPEALLFTIRNARGWLQKKVVEMLQESHPEILNIDKISQAVISGNIDTNTDTSVLILALKNIKDAKRRTCFSKFILKPEIALPLLEKFDQFRSYYYTQLKRANFPSYCVSDEAFRIYGELGSFGAQIIELILAQFDKLSPKTRVSDILQKTVSHAPGAASGVFQKRGILINKFVELISNSKFVSLSNHDQRLILGLKTPSGKSAFKDALKKRRFKEKTLRDFEQNTNFLDFLICYDPTIIQKREATITECLAALVYNPSAAKNLSLKYSQSELIQALPGAVGLLQMRSRAAAALELAVLSNLSVLPIFLQLVGKLAPPYKNEDLGRRYDAFYTTYNLPKKSGGNRLISAPSPMLKLAQRALLPLIYAEELSDFASGFRPGKNITDNALPHVRKEIVVNADIRNFFPSTTYKMIYSLSRRIRSGSLSPLAARLFSEICSHSGHLATGAPSSPAVSNILLKPLDDSLAKIAHKLDISYSRYADDITFSGGSAAVWMLKPLEKSLAKMGYELDPKKTNIFRKGRRQTVTGVVVNQKISLARPLRKKLRAAVHRRLNDQQPTMYGQPLSDQALKGYLSYLLMLAPEHANPLLKKLQDSKKWPH